MGIGNERKDQNKPSWVCAIIERKGELKFIIGSNLS